MLKKEWGLEDVVEEIEESMDDIVGEVENKSGKDFPIKIIEIFVYKRIMEIIGDLPYENEQIERIIEEILEYYKEEAEYIEEMRNGGWEAQYL